MPTDDANEHRIELSSPVCYAEELDRAYRDLIDRSALLAALNELLEAERAGARTALAMLDQIDDQADKEGLAEAVRTIHRGEVHWCGVLMTAIRRLDGTPSANTGDFFEKVMAYPGLPAPLALHNRGQAWVTRKLQALLPRIDDDTLTAALGEMLQAHHDNIHLVELKLQTPGA
jgi:nitronate monooxygenase